MSGNVEIEELIGKFLSGEASPDEAMELDNWSRESESNQKTLNRYITIYGIPGDEILSKLKKKGWQAIKAAINSRRTPITSAPGWWISAAVAIFFVLGSSILYYAIFQNKTTSYASGATQRHIQLSDASDITLAPNSKIILHEKFGENNRSLSLVGSASFSVIHDSTKPFIVHIKELKVTDLGTKFSISSSKQADTVDISVQEGIVSVQDNHRVAITLQAGHQFRYVRPTANSGAIDPNIAIDDDGSKQHSSSASDTIAKIEALKIIVSEKDTLWLKKSTKRYIKGSIIGITESSISFKKGASISHYTNEELSKIAFGAADDLFEKPGKTNKTSFEHLYGSRQNPADNEGSVVLTCNECGIQNHSYKGALTIVREESSESSIHLIPPASDSYLLVFKANLTAGNYRWYYNDNRRNSNHGIFKIVPGEKIKVNITNR